MKRHQRIQAHQLNQVKQKVAGALGQYTIIGNKNDCIDKLEQIYKAKLDGVALTFYDFFNDTKFFAKNILPKIKKFWDNIYFIEYTDLIPKDLQLSYSFFRILIILELMLYFFFCIFLTTWISAAVPVTKM